MMKQHKYIPSISRTAHENDPPTVPAAPTVPVVNVPLVNVPPTPDPVPAPGDQGPAVPAAPTSGKFTQVDVDRIVRHRLRKAEEEQKKVIGEMNALKARADLTREERADFEARVELLNNSLLTAEELATKDRKKQEETYTQQISQRDSEIDIWKNRYTESTIQRSITDAAIQHKSFYPEQVVSILDRGTRLVEELIDGNPTDRLIPMVRFADVDDKGKPVVLDLSPLAAVKRMTEMSKFQNLFEGKGTGGVGSRNHPSGGKQDLVSQTKNLDAYMKGRREGSIKL